MQKTGLDLEGRSLNELDEIHEAVMRARERAAVERQNELIKQYQALRAELVKHGVAKDEDLPRFKQRGWSRTPKPH